MKTGPLRIMLTGGGTGGHVFPAIAIADAIKQQRPDTQFLFVGAESKMEMERVPQSGYEIIGLSIVGFQRGLSWTSLKRNLKFPFKLYQSTQKAKRIVKDFVPDIVIGTGGYASGPVMRVAQQLGVPTLIQEQNSFPGVTNRLLSKNATKICVAYDQMGQWFPADKLEYTGNPVRQDILDLSNKRAAGIEHFQLNSGKKTIFITGGSLGAKTLNTALKEGLLKLNEDERSRFQFLWQCGKVYYEQDKTSGAALLPNVKILPFVDRVDLAYAAADVVVARAGALTISELCLIGKPAVLVPSPNVAEDHQSKNALALSQIGAARCVKDSEAIEKMLPEAFMILDNEALSFSLSENIRPLGKPDAARAIADVVLYIIEK